MNSNVGIIGGADGPTAIYVTSSFGWINMFGIILVVLMLIPNVIYAIKHHNEPNHCQSRLINILEQIGRYGCMLLMIFNIGLNKFGFSSVTGMLIYFFGNGLLLLEYWICWALYLKKPLAPLAMALAILPTCIFLLSGLTLRHWLLVLMAIVFGISHIYITRANNRN